jgi:hypothetical protein
VTDDPRRPGLLLLDCDSWTLRGRHAFETKLAKYPFPGSGTQNPTPDPHPHDTEPHYTQRADLYRAGLIAQRCLMENLAGNDLDEHRLRRFMTGRQVQFLRSLLDPAVKIDRQEVRNVGQDWVELVRPDGRMFKVTTVGGLERWTPRSPR